MKKILSLSPSKIYLVCTLSMFSTLGAFWHHQVNQTQLDRLNVLNQGVGTCFNRISQTFTAMMIKDIQSPYLNRGFMGLSDECLNETIKGINPFKKNVGKGYETLNQLISEVHWFHEKVSKLHGPLLANPAAPTALGPLTDRFGKMETYKMGLVDEIDAASTQLRNVQMNDELLMGSGLILFVLALTLLSLQDFNRNQLKKEIEREALNFLKAGNSNVGALVDQLVDRALVGQGLPVTAQIFRDYHGNLLEKMASTKTAEGEAPTRTAKVSEVTAVAAEAELDAGPVTPAYKTSLKEVLVAIQNLHPKDTIHMADVRDVQLNVPYEAFEQMLNSAVNQLAARKSEHKKIMIGNQIHSDKSVVNLFLGGSTFNASELEFAQGGKTVLGDAIDMNLVILREMVSESGAQWHLENKVDRNGNITGMNIRFTLNRTPKERSKLVSVMKGKKKDLTRELMN
jgi:hypothetical protein